MVEGLMNAMGSKVTGVDESEVDLEKVALVGAEAIQRIIADRNDLRQHALAQHRELVALSAINEDLRRRIALIRDHYVELGTKILAQLEQFDEAFRELMREEVRRAKSERTDAGTEHDNLVALAHRLRPNTATTKLKNQNC